MIVQLYEGVTAMQGKDLRSLLTGVSASFRSLMTLKQTVVQQALPSYLTTAKLMQVRFKFPNETLGDSADEVFDCWCPESIAEAREVGQDVARLFTASAFGVSSQGATQETLTLNLLLDEDYLRDKNEGTLKNALTGLVSMGAMAAVQAISPAREALDTVAALAGYAQLFGVFDRRIAPQTLTKVEEIIARLDSAIGREHYVELTVGMGFRAGTGNKQYVVTQMEVTRMKFNSELGTVRAGIELSLTRAIPMTKFLKERKTRDISKWEVFRRPL